MTSTATRSRSSSARGRSETPEATAGASTLRRPRARGCHRSVPNRHRRYIRHRLRAPAPDRVKYDTELTITHGHGHFLLGGMRSEFGKCEGGRRVGVFKWRPVGADRKVGAATSHNAFWAVPPPSLKLQPLARIACMRR